MVEENIMHQELRKICREKVCRIKVFRAYLGNSGKIPFSPLNFPASPVLNLFSSIFWASLQRTTICFVPVALRCAWQLWCKYTLAGIRIPSRCLQKCLSHFALHSPGMKVFAHIKLLISSWQLLPWLETISVPLLSDAHPHPTCSLLMPFTSLHLISLSDGSAWRCRNANDAVGALPHCSFW